jgi:glycosyltransferase involved in cell wall biosynthesis
MRVVTNFHEMYIPFGRSLKRNLGALWQRAAAVSMASGSHAISVTASEWERRLKGIGIRKRIRVIPVGSNIPQATINELDRARVRKELLGGSNGLLVAGLGAMHDRDVPAVLYGLQQMQREWPTKLFWIGGGSLDQQSLVSINQAVQDNGLDNNDVEWTGVLPHPEVSRLLSACDVVILPFVDGVSTRRTTAMTALQHGLPLLTTRSARLEPFFSHGHNSYLIPAGDKQALASAMVELGGNPKLRARLARGGRALYETNFAWDVIAQQVASVAQDQQDL